MKLALITWIRRVIIISSFYWLLYVGKVSAAIGRISSWNNHFNGFILMEKEKKGRKQSDIFKPNQSASLIEESTKRCTVPHKHLCHRAVYFRNELANKKKKGKAEKEVEKWGRKS